jgi:DNA polymerase III subunit delta
VTPEQAINEAESGKLRPVYLILGEEVTLAARVVRAIRDATLKGGIEGLNDDTWMAGEVDAAAVASTARTMPMLAPRRFVCLRGLERWESKGKNKAAAEKPKAKATKKSAQGPLDLLQSYVSDASETTTLVLTASKLNGRRKLVANAKKQGWLVNCDRLKPAALTGWVVALAKERSAKLAPRVAGTIAELCGPELGNVEDAVERLSLYAGPDSEITEAHITECITKVRPATVWQLVDAVGRGNLGAALGALGEVFDNRDRGLPLVGLLASSTRQMLKYSAARRSGASPDEATKAAGAPPFKARDLEAQMGAISEIRLARWLETLAKVDRDLKGGSKRPPRATLEVAMLDLCQRSAKLKQRQSGRTHA